MSSTMSTQSTASLSMISRMRDSTSTSRAPGEKVVNLNVYRIQRALRQEGFDLIRDDNGKLTLVLRVNKDVRV